MDQLPSVDFFTCSSLLINLRTACQLKTIRDICAKMMHLFSIAMRRWACMFTIGLYILESYRKVLDHQAGNTSQLSTKCEQLAHLNTHCKTASADLNFSHMDQKLPSCELYQLSTTGKNQAACLSSGPVKHLSCYKT